MADVNIYDKDGKTVAPVKTTTPAGTEAGLYVRVVSQPGGGGGGPATIADGADVAEGATTDAAVTGDNTGSVSAKLRGLSKILADVWDSVNHWLKVSIQNTSIAVTGTFWQATQPVSGTVTANAGTNLNTSALALETGGNLATIATNTTGAAKDASLTTIDTDLKATQPRDVTDRTARLLGHVTVDTLPALVTVQHVDEQGNKTQDSELRGLFQQMVTELRAIRIGTQYLIAEMGNAYDKVDLLEQAQESYDEEVTH